MTATKTSPNSRPAAQDQVHAPAGGDAAAARTKLAEARRQLMARMIERDDEIESCLVALVAGEHVLFVGPPGTGKSMLCDSVAELLHGGKFSYLMTKFTAPEEVFGPISLSQLKLDRYVRVTSGKLPEAEVAFLDEIFKSSSAILNTLLKVLNERTFDAGVGAVKCPLRLCIAASNEFPAGESQQELGALFDRFLIRRVVRPVSTAAGEDALMFGPEPAPLSVTLSGPELDAARAEAAALPWSAEATDALKQILRELAREGIIPGDRRKRKAVGVVRAAAWLDGSAEVKPEHLGVLADVLWDSPEGQPVKAAEVVAKVANPTGFQVTSLLVEAEQVMAATDTKNLAAVTQAAQKLTEVHKSLQKMKGHAKADKAITYVAGRIRALKQVAIDAI